VGKSVDPRQSGGPAGRNQGLGWLLCHPRTGPGRGTNHRANHPAPSSRGTAPVPHKPHRRRRRVPCCGHYHTSVMLTGLEVFRPFAGPSGDLLQPQWEALHNGTGNLWPLELLRSAQTAWTTPQRRRSHFLGTKLRPALTPYLPPLMPAQRHADVTMPASSAACAALPRPGSTSSHSHICWSSRAGRSRLASATGLASPCCP
jgi:hypothetical protein